MSYIGLVPCAECGNPMRWDGESSRLCPTCYQAMVAEAQNDCPPTRVATYSDADQNTLAAAMAWLLEEVI